MTPFVILALHRTGSTFLVKSLNGHPDIVCDSELFGPDARTLDMDPNDPSGSLDRWLELRSNVPFAGFKLILDQSAEAVHEVARRRFRAIFLTRPNELARHSSQLIARKTGKRSSPTYAARFFMRLFKFTTGSYNSPTAKFLIESANRYAPQKTEKVNFDKGRFQNMSRKADALVRNADSILAQHGLKPLRLEYPHVTTPHGIRTVLRFIGAEQVDLVASSERMNPPDILERFSNPDDVRQFLSEQHRQEWATEGTQV
jgi:hypothetical protein